MTRNERKCYNVARRLPTAGIKRQGGNTDKSERVQRMNILFFLTPKNEVAHVMDTNTLRQVLEKMEYHRYSSIPMLDRSGKYVGTITEGDLLWAIQKEVGLNRKDYENIPISKIPRKTNNLAVNVNAEVEDLINMAINQNFVPVTDDNNIFIGIVKRSDIIQYCYRKIKENEKK